MRIAKLSPIILFFFSMAGVGFLIVSYLCFIYFIPGYTICGSACESWWFWYIDFLLPYECVALCVPRNVLYIPFYLIGFSFIVVSVFIGFYYIYNKFQRK